MQLEQALLTTWLRHLPYESVQQAELERLAEHVTLSLADFRAGLLRLQNKGIVQTKNGPWDEKWFTLPTLNELYRQCFSLEDRSVQRSIPQGECSVIVGENSLFNAFFRMLIYIYRHPLERTKRGTWNKKQQAELQRFIGLEPELRSIPLSAKLTTSDLLEMGVELQYLIEDDHRLMIDQEKVRRWLQLPRSEAELLIYGQWKNKLLEHTSACEQHFVRWLESYQYELAWVSLQSFYQWLQSYELGEKNHVESFVQRWLQWLVQYGWIQMVETQTGDIYVKWMFTLETDSEGVYVQPDFELLVPPEVSLFTWWWIEAIAEPKQMDAASFSRYTITKPSIERALQSGYTSGQMIEFLSGVSKFPLPNNIMMAIQQWSEPFQSVQRDALSYILPPDHHSISSMQRVPQNPSYRSTDEDYDLLYPYLETIPSIWLEQMRSYHHSNYEKMIRTALYYHARLRCRFIGDQEDETKWIVPLQLYVDDDNERFFIALDERKRRVKIAIHQIAEMQLILPGVNDRPRLWEKNS